MTPRDLARIGKLILDDGKWEGKQVVPADWLAQSLQVHATVAEFRRCGYHWHLGQYRAGNPGRLERRVGAFGNGGRRLYVLPGVKLAVAITAGASPEPPVSGSR